MQIFKHLAALPPDPLTEKETILQNFPFRTIDNPLEPHPGLRAYPFLGQVWQGLVGFRVGTEDVPFSDSVAVYLMPCHTETMQL